MELSTVLGIFVAVAFVLLLVMLTVVVLGRINALHKNGHEPERTLVRCPYCGTELDRYVGFSVPDSDHRGLVYCRQCSLTFKQYTTEKGLSVLEEVFGTPYHEYSDTEQAKKTLNAKHGKHKDVPTINIKLCVFCEYFDLEMGDEGYSEMTPGSETVIKCRQNYWEMENGEDDSVFRANIIKAVTCSEYKGWPDK